MYRTLIIGSGFFFYLIELPFQVMLRLALPKFLKTCSKVNGFVFCRPRAEGERFRLMAIAIR